MSTPTPATHIENPHQALAAHLGLPVTATPEEVTLAALDALREQGSAAKIIFAVGDSRIAVGRVDSVVPSAHKRTLAVQLTKGAFVVLHDLEDPVDVARQLCALVDGAPNTQVVHYQPSRPVRRVG